MRHIPGKNNTATDAISRYPATADDDPQDFAIEEYVQGVGVGSLSSVDNLKVISWQNVENASRNDPILTQLSTIIRQGFPNDIGSTPTELKPYFKFRNQLTTTGGAIMFKNRVVIPHSLRKLVLENIH